MPEKKIGGRTYRVEKMPASDSFKTLVRLTKIVGPGMGRLQAAIGGADPKAADVLPAIADIIMASSPDQITDFAIDVAERAQVQTDRGGAYDPVIFDLHFDNIMEALQVVAFVLQVN